MAEPDPAADADPDSTAAGSSWLPAATAAIPAATATAEPVAISAAVSADPATDAAAGAAGFPAGLPVRSGTGAGRYSLGPDVGDQEGRQGVTATYRGCYKSHPARGGLDVISTHYITRR